MSTTKHTTNSRHLTQNEKRIMDRALQRSVQIVTDTPNTTDYGILLLERVGSLYEALAHGSDEHRAWLKKAIEDHFAGRPVETPRE